MQLSNRRILIIASTIPILLGASHILLDLFSQIFDAPDLKNPLVTKLMQSFYIKAFGTERSYYTYFTGFSIAMGMFMVFYGSVNLFAVSVMERNKKMVLFNLIASFVVVIFSAFFFNLGPVIGFSFATALFGYFYFKR